MAITAATLTAFNLLCTGTLTTGTIGQITRAPQTPVSYNYRIDLERGLWCEGECKETARIVMQNERELYLSASNGSDPTNWEVIKISRESGTLERDVRSGSSTIIVRAQCEKAPFAGMPRPLF